MVMVGGGADETGELREAFRRWASTAPGAPARLEEQVSGVETRDEVLVRLAMTVARRDLVEARGPCHSPPRGAATDPAVIDPFAHSLEDLRARTEHARPCDDCRGLGQAVCGLCAGSGRAPCGECGGSGNVRRYYKTTSSKLIQCPTCRTRGTVACNACGKAGRVTCAVCSGAGRSLAWWTWREQVTTTVRLSSESPILAAFPQLRAERGVTPQDLAPFTVQSVVEHAGMLTAQHLGPQEEALRWQPTLDPRRERLTWQQYARFGVRRRDVSYELCGRRGTVTLSGLQLQGASTPEALQPLRRRRVLWLLATLALAVVWSVYFWHWTGRAEYFVPTNRLLLAVGFLGLVASALAVGGALRAWRPSAPRWPLRGGDYAWRAAALAALVLCPLGAWVGRPTMSEARTALHRNDVSRARQVVEALQETSPSPQVTALLDEVDLADARRLGGAARLRRLDAVSSRNGALAAEARQNARRQRLDEVRAELAARRPDAALAKLDEWSAALTGDADAAELRAAAHDQRRAACADDGCRFNEARSARAAHATPARDGELATARGAVLRALASRELSADDPAAAVRSLRATTVLAATVGATPDDAEVTTAARTAAAWAEAERARIPLMGAAVASVNDILGRPAGSAFLTGWADLAGVGVWTAASSDGSCEGLYVIGAAEGARTLRGREAGVRRLLAQATGRADATVHPRAASAPQYAVVRWREGSTPVTARWAGDVLVELRIGRADPQGASGGGGGRRRRH